MALRVLADYPQVVVFDAAAHLCDERWCWVSRDGKMLYTDPHHLSVAGSRLLAGPLRKAIDGEPTKRLPQ